MTETEPHELAVAPLATLRARRSAKWRQYGDDVIPLTVAESDYALNPAVAAALRTALDGDDTGYAWAAGDLGTAAAAFAARRWGWAIDPERVTACSDVAIGVVEVLRALRPQTGAGRVGISPPVYPPFPGWVGEAGASLVEIPLDAGHRLDLPALGVAFAQGLDAYVLCSPHNPVGTVHTPAELARLIELAARHDVTIVSDEIHAPLTLPGADFTPLLTVPGAAARAVSLLSASKAWNVAGLKCAAIVSASDAMDDIVRRIPIDLRYRVGHLGVVATIAAWNDESPWLDHLLATVDARRTQLGALLTERLPLASWRPPQATYLAWIDVSAYGADARERFLAGGVALEPGSRFGRDAQGLVRLNFATGAAVLDEATARMAAAIG